MLNVRFFEEYFFGQQGLQYFKGNKVIPKVNISRQDTKDWFLSDCIQL